MASLLWSPDEPKPFTTEQLQTEQTPGEPAHAAVSVVPMLLCPTPQADVMPESVAQLLCATLCQAIICGHPSIHHACVCQCPPRTASIAPSR